jgi:general L-amino acid transport system permease protein
MTLSFFIPLGLSFKKNWWNQKLLLIWGIYFLISYWLLLGGFGLKSIEREQIGGLPLTLMLSLIGMVLSYPLGVLLALGRRSIYPSVQWSSILLIEVIRGVPLISILFMSSVMIPLFLPSGMTIDKILRAQVAFIIFTAANMAEVVRGGLQSIPKGQFEAADSLGLNYIKKTWFVILPQALRPVIPATVSTSLSLFKDTSLVSIISLFDLLSTMKLAQKDFAWAGFEWQAYVIVGFIYFILCRLMAAIGHKMEKHWKNL